MLVEVKSPFVCQPAKFFEKVYEHPLIEMIESSQIIQRDFEIILIESVVGFYVFGRLEGWFMGKAESYAFWDVVTTEVDCRSE